jgi:hypothetical protein
VVGEVKVKKVIISYSFSNTDILNSINKLYLNNKGFILDPTYGRGNFYKDFKQPTYRFDIKPQSEGVEKFSSTNLPIKDNSIQSICFDPPFLIGYGNCKANKNISAMRFGIFPYYRDLMKYYEDSAMEFSRILKMGGILAWKCQDYATNPVTKYFMHIDVYKIATKCGFLCWDLFILLAKQRI